MLRLHMPDEVVESAEALAANWANVLGAAMHDHMTQHVFGELKPPVANFASVWALIFGQMFTLVMDKL